MKRFYIIPNTTSVLIQSGLVCQVTSIHGNGPDFGGENSSIDPG